jgi:hypothetical protein
LAVKNVAEIKKKHQKPRRKPIFKPPKVKVPQKSFDDVLAKLIQSEPQPEKRLK